MKQLVFTAFLIFAVCNAAFAHKNNLLENSALVGFDELVMFDEYRKLPWKAEKARLENLFLTVAKDENLKSLIVIKFDKNESRKKKIKRLKKIAEFLDFMKVDKNKFTFAIMDFEREVTELWVEPLDANLEDLLNEPEDYKIIKAEELKQKTDELFPKK